MESIHQAETKSSRRSWVLVSGATGGLGKAFAVECASRGWAVYLTDLRQDLLDTLAGGLRRTYGVPVETTVCDLTDISSRQALFERFEREGQRFWALINVAGIDFEGPFYEQSRAQIRTIIRLNVEGTLEMTHALLARRDPLVPFRIINVASLAAFYPMPVKATYAASKRFLLDFSLALRSEVKELGATVTALCPAGLATNPDMIRAIHAQGVLGQLTTQDIGAVASETLDAALKGRAVVIPGWINRAIQFAGSLLPTMWVVSLVGSRWKTAQQKRARQAEIAAG